jgi:hypothetical protein
MGICTVKADEFVNFIRVRCCVQEAYGSAPRVTHEGHFVQVEIFYYSTEQNNTVPPVEVELAL